MRAARESLYALVIDLGTTACKVGLADLGGTVLWSENHETDTVFGADGAAEQDAEAWWTTIMAAAERGMRSGTVHADRVVAVAITGQWSSTVAVDEVGNPIAPCLLWMDRRGHRAARRQVGGPAMGYDPRKVASWVRRSGGAPALDGADALGHRWFLRDEKPELWNAARWLLEPVDYLAMRFSGVAAASPASMTGAWLTDNRNLATLQYDPELLRLAGLDTEKLPPLQAPLTSIGVVQPRVAAALGLGDDVRVIGGLPDLHTAALGAGATADYAAHLAISTTSWISCHVTKKKTDILHSIATVPSALPGRYLVVNNQDTAGRSLHWLRELLGVNDYAQLDAMAASASPGSNGVIFAPWLAGERSPVGDKHARAGFHNMSLATRREDLVRAVLEGVAYNSRWLLRTVEKFVGRTLDPIRVIGGGASSPLWCQIFADVLNRTIEQPPDPVNAGLRGAALSAAIVLGATDIAELPSLVPAAHRYTPNDDNHKVYDRLSAELPHLYAAQRKIFGRLNAAPPSRQRSIR